MGGEQAAKVMAIVTEDKMKRAGKEADPKFLEAMQQKIIDQFNSESDALAATARLFDDGLIDPRDTRRVLAYTLSICREAATRSVATNSFGVARF